MVGKGHRRRSSSILYQEYENNWDKAYQKNDKKGTPAVAEAPPLLTPFTNLSVRRVLKIVRSYNLNKAIKLFLRL